METLGRRRSRPPPARGTSARSARRAAARPAVAAHRVRIGHQDRKRSRRARSSRSRAHERPNQARAEREKTRREFQPGQSPRRNRGDGPRAILPQPPRPIRPQETSRKGAPEAIRKEGHIAKATKSLAMKHPNRSAGVSPAVAQASCLRSLCGDRRIRPSAKPNATSSSTLRSRARNSFPCEDRMLTPEPPLAHANFHASQSLQSISISRFPVDVGWGLHVEHRHMDADRGAGMAHLPAEPFVVPARAGSVPGRDSDLSVHSDRRSSSGPDRAAKDSAGLAVHSDGECGDAHCSGDDGTAARVADFVSVVRVWICAGVWRAGVSGADSDAGRSRGHAECDRAEFNSIQSGGDGRAGAGGNYAGEVRREVVLRVECAFVSGAGDLAVDHLGAILAGEIHRDDVWQPEAGDPVHLASWVDGGSDYPGVSDDVFEHADADVYPGIRERYFPSRSGNVWQFAFADGCGIDLRIAGRGKFGEHFEKGPVRACDADYFGGGDCGILVFEVFASVVHDARAGGRFDDGGVRDGYVAGAVDCDQRNARARDERVQLRVSRRDADGKSGVKLAGADVYGSGGVGREWISAGAGGGLLSDCAEESGGAVSQSPDSRVAKGADVGWGIQWIELGDQNPHFSRKRRARNGALGGVYLTLLDFHGEDVVIELGVEAVAGDEQVAEGIDERVGRFIPRQNHSCELYFSLGV